MGISGKDALRADDPLTPAATHLKLCRVEITARVSAHSAAFDFRRIIRGALGSTGIL